MVSGRNSARNNPPIFVYGHGEKNPARGRGRVVLRICQPRRQCLTSASKPRMRSFAQGSRPVVATCGVPSKTRSAQHIGMMPYGSSRCASPQAFGGGALPMRPRLDPLETVWATQSGSRPTSKPQAFGCCMAAHLARHCEAFYIYGQPYHATLLMLPLGRPGMAAASLSSPNALIVARATRIPFQK